MLALDNMTARVDAKGNTKSDDRGVRGNTDWKLYSVEHDVPASARAIVFGALLTSEGTAWWDDFAVEIDGKPYRGKSLAELAAERQPKPAELDWLHTNAITFKTERAESGFDDLQPLKTIIGDAHIVGLGEATHGTAEFFRMKHRLVEFLASEKGFTIFAIEANMPEAYRVNDFVLNGKGDPKALLRGMYFWTWDTSSSAWLTRPLNHRSIGAMAYILSYPSVFPEEYDALIAFDDTTASKCLRLVQPR